MHNTYKAKKRNTKLSLCVSFLIIILFIFSACTDENDFSNVVTDINDFEFDIINEEAVLIKYYGSDEIVRIPDYYEGYPVTAIGDSAFFLKASITAVYIPPSVKTIGADSFADCASITEINIPSNVTSIGDSAFASCFSLKEIIIPKNVMSIGADIVGSCHTLENIKVDKANNYYASDDGVLYSKDKSTLFIYPDGKTDKSFSIPSSVTVLAARAFKDCINLTEIIFNSKITEINDETFSSCYNLSKIEIPESVTSIGAYAFSNCNSIEELILPSVITTIGDFAFNSCDNLAKINIPSSVTFIGRNAFTSCTKIKEITIPSSITFIGEGAFTKWESSQTIYMESREAKAEWGHYWDDYNEAIIIWAD